MAILQLFRFINSSLLLSQRPLNASAEQTVYSSCADMPAVLIFYLVLQFINMFLGIPANIMVLWLIHKNKGDSSSSDIFIVHLAVLDAFFCLIPPLELANIVYLSIQQHLVQSCASSTASKTRLRSFCPASVWTDIWPCCIP